MSEVWEMSRLRRQDITPQQRRNVDVQFREIQDILQQLEELSTRLNVAAQRASQTLKPVRQLPEEQHG